MFARISQQTPQPSRPYQPARWLAFLPLAGLLAACGNSASTINERAPRVGSAETLYNNGVDALRSDRYLLSVNQFDTLQRNYPYSQYTANAQLMEGYANYLLNKYPEAVQQLDRFLELHPTSSDAAYAFYLRALCYYEQVADVQRDQQGTIEAMDALEEVITRFPQSPYARDAQLKIDLCRDHLAGKEMLVGRYYQQQNDFPAAALERLVEVYLDMGLLEQARKTGSVLAYNYPSSKWYEDAYDHLRAHHLIKGVDGKDHKQGRNVFQRAWHSVF